MLFLHGSRMLIQPRSYQTECVERIYQYFYQNTGNPICALPTGTGKSVCIAMFLESVFRQWPNQKILILTHVKELIKQNFDKLLALWPTAPAGIYSAGLKQRETLLPIIFAGIGSVVRNAQAFGFVDIVIVDEAHLVSPSEKTMYQKFFAILKQINPNLKIIGFTATPWRLGQGALTDTGVFTDICFDITGLEAFNRLIKEGFIAPLIPKQTETLLDVSGVHMKGGEFIPAELQNAVDKQELTYAALKEAIELGYDRKHWLIFAAGINHAIHIAEMLDELGVSCRAVHSKNNDERDEAINDAKTGKIRALVNNNILTTGFDFPEIDLILMLRPTASAVLWVQALGRGTRPAKGKENCLVLDYAGNTRRLGPINDPVIPRKPGQKGGTAPVKLCENCKCWNHASARVCAFCGAEFKFQTKLKQAASTEELIKADLPVMETYSVDHITYSIYEKESKPPMVKVNYYCGLRKFTQFICFQHEGFARRKAVEWWHERCELQCPDTSETALTLAKSLRIATHLRVWINKKYPEIMKCCFDGTDFGKQSANTSVPSTEIATNFVKKPSIKPEDFEDDIPF